MLSPELQRLHPILATFLVCVALFPGPHQVLFQHTVGAASILFDDELRFFPLILYPGAQAHVPLHPPTEVFARGFVYGLPLFLCEQSPLSTAALLLTTG